MGSSEQRLFFRITAVSCWHDFSEKILHRGMQTLLTIPARCSCNERLQGFAEICQRPNTKEIHIISQIQKVLTQIAIQELLLHQSP